MTPEPHQQTPRAGGTRCPSIGLSSASGGRNLIQFGADGGPDCGRRLRRLSSARTLPRYVHAQLATSELLAVESLDGGLCLAVAGHLHEAESPRASGLPVTDHLGSFHRAVRGEKLLQLGRICVEGEVPHIDVGRHSGAAPFGLSVDLRRPQAEGVRPEHVRSNNSVTGVVPCRRCLVILFLACFLSCRGHLRRRALADHTNSATPTTVVTPPQRIHIESPDMKLLGANATSRPCRIQTTPTRTRTTPEAALIWSRIGAYAEDMRLSCLDRTPPHGDDWPPMRTSPAIELQCGSTSRFFGFAYFGA